MIFTVIWKPLPEQKLADIWLSAPDRAAVSAAANTIDYLLRQQPETLGESRSGHTRVVVIPPLAVHFDVLVEDCQVIVLNVDVLPSHPPKDISP